MIRGLSLVCLLASLLACSNMQKIDDYAPSLADHDRRDGDFDGVINARDLCPDTPLRALVNNEGCSKEQNYSDAHELLVFFAHDSADIGKHYAAQLKKLAQFLARYPALNIAIEGHTSLSGSEQYNLKLAEARSQAVKTLLVEEYAVANERVTLLPLGEASPLINDELPQSESANRRARVFVEERYRNTVPRWDIYLFGEQ